MYDRDNKNLMDLEGSISVLIDKENGAVRIESTEEPLRLDHSETPAKPGHPETVINTILQKAESYLSCAIGRLDRQ